MQETATVQCSTCLLHLKTAKSFHQHKCQIFLCVPGEKPDLEVRGENEVKRLLGVLQPRQSMHQLLKFTDCTSTALPGLAPLFFPTRHFPPILDHLGCTHDSYTFLRAAALEGPVRLRKSLRFKIGDSVLKITKNLIPTCSSELKRQGLKLVDKGDHVVVYHISSTSQVSIFFLIGFEIQSNFFLKQNIHFIIFRARIAVKYCNTITIGWYWYCIATFWEISNTKH
jgi:hypothetical protein